MTQPLVAIFYVVAATQNHYTYYQALFKNMEISKFLERAGSEAALSNLLLKCFWTSLILRLSQSVDPSSTD